MDNASYQFCVDGVVVPRVIVVVCLKVIVRYHLF